ncbi:hypothetical protein [Kalamiella sp. sgz302252]|uniref:hypothetical protein n=1 Tax=Pantoea sp. sgz302252 TaxID=3341827 RepID=UPI0036D2473A
MLFKIMPAASAMLLVACSSGVATHAETMSLKAEQEAGAESITPVIKHAMNEGVPINPVASSNQQCIDYFNFLRQTGDKHYQKYAKEYTKISEGYDFLQAHEETMGADAKRVYTMELDMKLDTLCLEVNFNGYRVIQQKVRELYGI